MSQVPIDPWRRGAGRNRIAKTPVQRKGGGQGGNAPPKKAPRVAHCWHACGQSTPERRASTVDAAERKKEGARICDEGPGRRADLGVRGVLLRARGLVHHLLVAVVGVVCVPHRVVVGPVVAHNPVVSDCDGYPRKKKEEEKQGCGLEGRGAAQSAHIDWKRGEDSVSRAGCTGHLGPGGDEVRPPFRRAFTGQTFARIRSERERERTTVVSPVVDASPFCFSWTACDACGGATAVGPREREMIRSH